MIRKNCRLVINFDNNNQEISDNPENIQCCIIFLSLLKNSKTDKNVFSLSEISAAFGFASPQYIYYYTRKFPERGSSFSNYLKKKTKINAETAKTVKSVLFDNFPASYKDICEEVNRRPGRSDVTVYVVQEAIKQITGLEIFKEVRKNRENGKLRPDTKIMLQKFTDYFNSSKKEDNDALLKQLEDLNIKGSAAEDKRKVTKKFRDSASGLLDKNKQISDIPSAIKLIVVMLVLYYNGISLNKLGEWFNCSKSTVYNRIIKLSAFLWPTINGFIKRNLKFCCVHVDEKWMKIERKWCYWFVVLDNKTGLAVTNMLLYANNADCCKLVLCECKKICSKVKVIMTDGLRGYRSAVKTVFEHAKHLTCLFHHQQGVTRYLKKYHSDLDKKQLKKLKKKMKRVFQTKDPRTMRKRFKKLKKENIKKELGIDRWINNVSETIDLLIPAASGQNSYPSTNNPVESLFREFSRFYNNRGGFTNYRSAVLQLNLFMLMYVFTIQPCSGKAPIEKILPSARSLPLFKLINQPFTYCSSDGLEIKL